MKKAITQAIEAGYTYHCGKGIFSKGDGMKCYFSGANSEWAVWTREDSGSSICVSHEDTLLDPDFWYFLGKAKGWVDGISKEMAHICFSHILDGKDIESFFNNLLK